eukprot:3343878-Prymnesium_polylepis.1
MRGLIGSRRVPSPSARNTHTHTWALNCLVPMAYGLYDAPARGGRYRALRAPCLRCRVWHGVRVDERTVR